MIIPTSTRIGGHVVKVVLVDKLINEEGDALCGMASPDFNQITLARYDKHGRRFPRSTQEETYMHELMHCVLHFAGRNDLMMDEGLVTPCALLLHQALTQAEGKL